MTRSKTVPFVTQTNFPSKSKLCDILFAKFVLFVAQRLQLRYPLCIHSLCSLTLSDNVLTIYVANNKMDWFLQPLSIHSDKQHADGSTHIWTELPNWINDTLSSTDDRLLAFVAVYVFLGDYHALLDFVRYMHSKDTNGQLKKSEYVVIAVKDTTYDYEHREKYLMKCKKILKHDARQNTMSMHFYTIQYTS